MLTNLASLVQLCHGEGGILQTDITGCVGSARSVRATLGLPPAHSTCAFPAYRAQTPGCSEGELSKAGPGLLAHPRPKLLRFRFSGTPQGRRLGWACVLCPPQVLAARATRCLVSTLPQVNGASYHLPGPTRLVSGVHRKSTVSGVLCVSSGALISGCDPPGRCQPSRIPGRRG